MNEEQNFPGSPEETETKAAAVKDAQAASAKDLPAEAAPELSAGAMLRQVREEAGLHIAVLAFSLKVPVTKLEALEADRFDLLPDVVFARALASSVCRSLKVDPSAILERLPQTSAPQLNPDESGINVPYQAWGRIAHFSLKGRVSKTVAFAVIVLLAGVLVLAFLPWIKSRSAFMVDQPSVTSEMVTPLPLPTPPVVPPTVPVVPSAVAPEPSTAPEPNTAPVAAKVEPASPPVAPKSVPAPVTASVAAPVAQTAPALDTTSAAASAGSKSGLLTFLSDETSWIEVTDAAGVVRMSRNLEQGESVSVSGPLPLSVVVGNAQNTRVLVRGKSFDLAAVSHGNVARFEVK